MTKLFLVNKMYYGSLDEEVVECEKHLALTELHYVGHAELAHGPLPEGAECWYCAETRDWDESRPERERRARLSAHAHVMHGLLNEIAELLDEHYEDHELAAMPDVCGDISLLGVKRAIHNLNTIIEGEAS